MKKRSARKCSRCEKLVREIQTLKERLEAVEASLAKARKNSSNSSKPPSSDIVNPRASQQSGEPDPKHPKKKRKPGGQPGHPRHRRTPFAEHEIDQAFEYFYDRCPDCGGQVTATDDEPRVQQQAEFLQTPLIKSEHRGLACWCQACQKLHYAPLPDDLRRAGLAGPRLTTLVAYLKGACHASFSTIRKFLRDVVGIQLSRGYLRKLCAKVARALKDPWEELLALLPHEEALNVDETGHKDNGQRLWTWCFRAATYTLFKIDASRSSQVLVDVLGEEFEGVLGCDYFSAYRKYMRLNENVTVQFCLAHFIRDVKFLVEHPHSRNRAYGRRVLTAVKAMFALIHRRDEFADEGYFRGQLEDAGYELWTQATFRVPPTGEAQNLANRFRHHGPSYVRFITTPGIDPTNNVAEQAIRFVVIDRLITQGSRSDSGQRWLERIWSVMATCVQQDRRVFGFLHEATTAHLSCRPAPSLVPGTS